MRKLLLIILAAAIITGCTNKVEARRALEGAGYTNIQFHGYAWFMCGKEDTYATSFTATGPTGKPVSGAVCGGLIFKGQTIRTD